MISITVPELTELRYYELEQMNKEGSGVYLLYSNDDKLLYIGKATRLHERLVQHFRGKHCGYFHTAKFFFEPSKVNREIYETYLINELEPMLNIYKTYDYAANVGIRVKYSEEVRSHFCCKRVLNTGKRCSRLPFENGYCKLHA